MNDNQELNSDQEAQRLAKQDFDNAKERLEAQGFTIGGPGNEEPEAQGSVPDEAQGSGTFYMSDEPHPEAEQNPETRRPGPDDIGIVRDMMNQQTEFPIMTYEIDWDRCKTVEDIVFTLKEMGFRFQFRLDGSAPRELLNLLDKGLIKKIPDENAKRD